MAKIFGAEPSATATSTSSSPTPQRAAAIDDILSLFGPSTNLNNTATSAPSTPAFATPSAPTAFSMGQPQAQSPPVASQPQLASAPRQHTAYTAYDKNDLKITLTPQTSPTKPGTVMILARFQASGSSIVTAMNFQAAVPKVNIHL